MSRAYIDYFPTPFGSTANGIRVTLEGLHTPPEEQEQMLRWLKGPLRGRPLREIREARYPGQRDDLGYHPTDEIIEDLVAKHLAEYVTSGGSTRDWTVRALTEDQSARHTWLSRTVVEPEFGERSPEGREALYTWPYVVVEVSASSQRKPAHMCSTRPMAVERVREFRDAVAEQTALARLIPGVEEHFGWSRPPQLWIVCRNAGFHGGDDVHWVATDVVENGGARGKPLALSDVMRERLAHERIDWRGLAGDGRGAAAPASPPRAGRML